MIYEDYPNTIMLLSNDAKNEYFLQRSFAACDQATCVKAEAKCMGCEAGSITVTSDPVSLDDTGGILLSEKQCVRYCPTNYYEDSSTTPSLCKPCDVICD